MKKFVVYLMVIVLAVSLGFAVFYLVRDDEVISISSASIYRDVNDEFTIDVKHENKKSHTKIAISSSDSTIVSYNSGQNNFKAMSGGVARINFRTNNAKFRNLWCDVIVGDGSIESPFYISTIEQLSAIGMGKYAGKDAFDNDVYKGKAPYEEYSSDKAYKLVANIDVKTVNEGFWVPLRHFSGRFDGNGYVLSNINIDYDGYTAQFKDAKDYDPNLYAKDNVGLFQSIANVGMVYNLKLANYRANGIYTNFGVVAGINKGTIERVEVKDTLISVESDYFGGIAGKNITTDFGSGTTYVRNIARIDRCSVNLVLGKKRTFTNNQFVDNVIGITGYVGGLVGSNEGGTIVYSYSNGEVSFLSDNLESIIYGGLVATNTYIDLGKSGGNYLAIQGANIKDCYSNLKTNLSINLTNPNSKIAGVIAVNKDFCDYSDPKHSYYDGDTDKEIVQNYLIGTYYNKDNLNIAQKGITKNFTGIHTFLRNDLVIPFTENIDDAIVNGLTTAEMKSTTNFVSHYTSDIKFDKDGNSQGLTAIPVSWLFDTVWAMDNTEGRPILNYQLVYVPDDFKTVGTPVIIGDTRYHYINNVVEYPITIVSGNNRTLYIEVGETYNLKVAPAGLSLMWTTNNDKCVSVDQNGTITGVKEGSASITVTTAGKMYSDYIDVYVSSVSYTINGVQDKISMNVGDTRTLTGITVTPNAPINYSSTNPSIISVDSSGVITAHAKGIAYIEVSAGNAKKTIEVTVEDVTTAKAVVIELTQYVFTHSYSGNPITGKVDISNVKYQGNVITTPLTFSYTSSDANIASIDANGNYVVNGYGKASITIKVTTPNYIGEAYALIEVNQNSSSSVTAGITKPSYSINVGDSLKIDTFGPIQTIGWASSNSGIVSVDNNGNILGVAPGTATIYCAIYMTNGQYISDSCDVTVGSAPQTPIISLTPSHSQIYKGQSVTLTATCNISGATLQWTITQKDENGVATNNIADITSANNTSRVITMKEIGSVNVDVSYGGVIRSATIIATANTSYNPIIKTIDQLKAVKYNLDKDYYLAADLDLSGITNWEPIGNRNSPFTGNFYAQKKSGTTYFGIKNVNCNASEFAGLFGYIKNGSINNLTISNSTIVGTYAGTIAGVVDGAYIYSCNSIDNKVVGTYAGGIAGRLFNDGSIYIANVKNTEVKSQGSGTSYIGGVAGSMSSGATIYDVKVNNTTKYVALASSSHGYAGGIAGHSAGFIINVSVEVNKIIANNDDTDFAGGIVGYTTGGVLNGVVKNTSVEGYYVGGIGGSINASNKNVKLYFNVNNKGFRHEDLSSYSYERDVNSVAIKDSVKLKGDEVGGLFGVITCGVVTNCYTQANLSGGHVSGFASQILSNGFTNDGGLGQAGVVDLCYSACTFGNSKASYAITESLVHNKENNRHAGFVFRYAFDVTLAKKASYNEGNILNKDHSNAKKSTSEMKTKTTYTDKGFSSTYWNFGSGYPTLVVENSL